MRVFRMSKQQKINELTKNIEKLTKELNDIVNEPESKEVECYGDTLEENNYFSYIDIYGKESEGKVKNSNREQRLDFHNCYNRYNYDRIGTNNLTQQIKYQKIINRMWQLAYELNPNHINQDILCFDVFFHSIRKCWAPIEWDVPNEFPLPRFASKEIAQKAADDLNAKGYKL